MGADKFVFLFLSSLAITTTELLYYLLTLDFNPNFKSPTEYDRFYNMDVKPRRARISQPPKTILFHDRSPMSSVKDAEGRPITSVNMTCPGVPHLCTLYSANVLGNLSLYDAVLFNMFKSKSKDKIWIAS